MSYDKKLEDYMIGRATGYSDSTWGRQGAQFYTPPGGAMPPQGRGSAKANAPIIVHQPRRNRSKLNSSVQESSKSATSGAANSTNQSPLPRRCAGLCAVISTIKDRHQQMTKVSSSPAKSFRSATILHAYTDFTQNTGPIICERQSVGRRIPPSRLTQYIDCAWQKPGAILLQRTRVEKTTRSVYGKKNPSCSGDGSHSLARVRSRSRNTTDACDYS